MLSLQSSTISDSNGAIVASIRYPSNLSCPSQPKSSNISNFTKIRSAFTKTRRYRKKSPPSSSAVSSSKSKKTKKTKKNKNKFSISLLSGCCFTAQKTLSPHIANHQMIMPSTTNNKFIYPPATNNNSIELPLSTTKPALSINDEIEIEIEIEDISNNHSSLSSITSNNKKRSSLSSSCSKSKSKKRGRKISKKLPLPLPLEGDTLSIHGYSKKKQIAPTLQGSVFIATKTRLNKEYLLISGYINNDNFDESIYDLIWRYYEPRDVVIKTALKSLHFAGVTIKDGNKYSIQEDIVKEAKLMKSFMRNNVPSTMIKYYSFFEDDDTFYLIMEKGGISLFEFTVNVHEMIKNKKLDIKYWRKCVKFIFAKMSGFIAWMHKEMNCCNLDISLENIVMSEDTKFDEKSGIFINLDIRFIDFGLTENFDENKSSMNKCNKFVGKTGYKAPKVLNKKTFIANKADTWSLGICLFMLSFGAPPFKKANIDDPRYNILEDGQLKNMVHAWDRWKYVTLNQFDLIEKLLCIDQNKRYDIDDVMKHQWLKVYFGQYLNENNDYDTNTKRKQKRDKPFIAESKTNTFQCDDGDYIASLEH